SGQQSGAIGRFEACSWVLSPNRLSFERLPLPVVHEQHGQSGLGFIVAIIGHGRRDFTRLCPVTNWFSLRLPEVLCYSLIGFSERDACPLNKLICLICRVN